MNSSYFYIEENKIHLSSFLEENSFGRTDLGKLVSEKGILAEFHDNGTIETEEWFFNGNHTAQSKTVYFEGDASSVNKTLLQVMEETSDSRSKDKAVQVLKVMDLILEKNLTVIPGPAGILLSDNLSATSGKVLFLPANLFDRCMENSREYGTLQGSFVHKGLSGLESSLFTRSAVAYRILADKNAFPEKNLEKRQSDFYDRNFIPVEYEVNGIPETLSSALNAGLKVKAKKLPVPGERRFVNKKEEDERLKNLKHASEYTARQIELFLTLPDSQKKNLLSEKAFEEKRNAFKKKQKRIISAKRFYERNSRKIWGTAIAAVVCIYAFNSFHQGNLKLATTMGLNSRETVESLYTAINRTDVSALQEITKGKGTKDMRLIVSADYVTSRQRLAVSEKSGTLTPAQWLFFKGKSDFWQYGVTNLKIDGENGSVEFNYPIRKDKKEPLLIQDGKPLKKGDEKTHSVTYNLVRYNGESIIEVARATETVTLKWNGKRWLVTDAKGKVRNNTYKTEEYRKDWIDAVKECDNNLHKAREILAAKYSFVPREDEMVQAAPYLIKQYNNSAAKDFLSQSK